VPNTLFDFHKYKDFKPKTEYWADQKEERANNKKKLPGAASLAVPD